MSTVSALIIEAASMFTAIMVLVGGLWAGFKFFYRQQIQDSDMVNLKKEHVHDINLIREEQQMICYGVLACLDGLKQQGCNGNVTQAHTALEKYLNKAAHINIEE